MPNARTLTQDDRDAIDDLVECARAGGASELQRRVLRAVLEGAAARRRWWGAQNGVDRRLGLAAYLVRYHFDRALAAIGRATPHDPLFDGAEQLVGRRLCEVVLGLEGLKRRRVRRRSVWGLLAEWDRGSDLWCDPLEPRALPDARGDEIGVPGPPGLEQRSRKSATRPVTRPP